MKIVTVSDLSLSGSVDRELIHQIFEGVEDSSEKIFIDFSGTSVWVRDVDVLAGYVSTFDVETYGLSEEVEEALGSHLSKEEQSHHDNFEDFIDMFKTKFPEGTLCIWDRTVSKNVKKNHWSMELPYSLIRITGYDDYKVYFRRYKSANLEPVYIKAHGGLDGEGMYLPDQIHLSNLSSQDEVIRYPKDEEEETLLRIFTEI